MKLIHFLFVVILLWACGHQKVERNIASTLSSERSQYDWLACAEKGNISKLKHSNVPFRGTGLDKTKYKFIEECVPDTLYSWQGGSSLMNILNLKGSVLPFQKEEKLKNRGLYFWRTPAGTFGYNDFLLRAKLKEGTNFVFIDELKDLACTWVMRKYGKIPPQTVFVRYKSGLEIVDYILCDDSALHSWSIWSKEGLEEINREKEFIEKSSCSKMIETFRPVDGLEKKLQSLLSEEQNLKYRIRKYQKKIQRYETRKRKKAKKSRKKLKASIEKNRILKLDIRKTTNEINTITNKSLAHEKDCWSWEAYSNASKVDIRLFKLVFLYQRMNSAEEEAKETFQNEIDDLLENWYPSLLEENDSFFITQQIFGDRNKTKDIRSNCGDLFLGHCLDRSKDNWRGIQLKRKMQLYGEKEFVKTTGLEFSKIEKSKSDLTWWNKKSPEEKVKIKNLLGKEIIRFAHGVAKSRADHFFSKFRTIYNP